MRPSSSCEVVATLDKEAELSVLFSAVQAAECVAEPPEIVERFRTETRQPPNPQMCMMVGVVGAKETWKAPYSFNIRHEDEDFVLEAARAVLDEPSLYQRIKDQISFRRSAAKRLADFFGESRKWRTWP